MKKFTSLFALLSCLCVVSAQAEDHPISIWYETSDLYAECLPNVYFFIDKTTNTGWPGPQMQWMQDTDHNTKIYKWEGTLGFMPTQFIFSFNGNRKTADLPFTNNGYFKDGNLQEVIDIGDGGYTVYFYDANGTWGNNICCYVWHNSSNVNNSWPGKEMTSLGNNLYSFYIKGSNYSNLIFTKKNNNNQADYQTANLTAVDGKLYTKDGALVLSDDSNFPSVLSGYKVDAKYTRTGDDYSWNTLCLPFAINTKNYKNVVTFYQLSNATSSQISFTPISGVIAAGTPVVYKLSTAGADLTIEEEGVTVSNTITPSTPITDWTMNGTFEYQNDVDNIYFIWHDGFYHGKDIKIRPYRAWFESSVVLTPVNGAPIRISVEDTEGLQFVEQEDGTVKAYFDLQGRKLDGARKGLVIENGKIIMVK